MSLRAWTAVKATSLIFVAIAAWLVLLLTVGHSWFEATVTRGPAVGVIGYWSREALANMPELAYFLAVGAALYYFSGPARTIWWVVALGVIAMVIKAAMRNYTYHQAPDLVDIGGLFIDLALPALLALVGALVVRGLLARPPGAQRAT